MQFGVIKGGASDSFKLDKISGWAKTEIVTLTEDKDLVADYAGYLCFAVEDIDTSGKTITYWELGDNTSVAATKYHNFANSYYSGIQPQIVKLKYDAAQCTKVKLYFVKNAA